jgi:hypothetical protein
MKKPLPRINMKYVFRYFLLIIISSVVLLCTFIALPSTESVFKKQTFNLNVNDSSSWEKTFAIKLTFQPTDIVYKGKLVNKTKDVIYERLKKYGVDFVQISYKDGTDNTGTLSLTVKGRNDSSNIEALVTSNSDIYLVTKKADANFNDEKNQYAIYDPANYDSTDLTREYFRTIYITKLKSSSGDYTYFGLFKTYIWKDKAYYQFIEKYSGLQEGLYIDGFVSPLTVPVWSADQNSARPTLSIGLTSNEKVAHIQGIIFNSGKIPLTMEVSDKQDVTVGKVSINTLILSVITIVSILVVLIVKHFLDKKEIIKYPLTLFIISILGLAFLKISQTPISLVSLLIAFPIIILTTIMLGEVKRKLLYSILIATLLFIIKQFTLGQTSEILNLIMIGVFAFPIFECLSQRYILLFKQILGR